MRHLFITFHPRFTIALLDESCGFRRQPAIAYLRVHIIQVIEHDPAWPVRLDCAMHNPGIEAADATHFSGNCRQFPYVGLDACLDSNLLHSLPRILGGLTATGLVAARYPV
jgi:hypothetical protein